jgi:hypothetical protein
MRLRAGLALRVLLDLARIPIIHRRVRARSGAAREGRC